MDTDSNIAKNTILEPLSLNPIPENNLRNEESSFCCMFCDHSEKEDKHENKAILKHMFTEHRIVIADVQDIRDLRQYLEFWKKEFKCKEIL